MRSWLQQCKFEILGNVRNRRFFFFSLLLPIGFYFLYVNLEGANLSIEGTSWDKYYLMSMATFSVVGTGLNGLSGRIAFERTQGWLRLVQTTPLSSFNYVTTKIIAQLVINVTEVLLLFIAASLFEHVHLTLFEWVMSGLWIAFGGLAFILLGILVGLVAGKDAAQIVSSAIYFLLSITGGLWFPVAAMPGLMKDIANWMPTYHLAHVAWQLVANRSPSFADFIVLLAYIAVFMCLAMFVASRRPDKAV